MREHDVKKIIFCPVCGNKFHKGLYDFRFIHCNDGCRTIFNKETGEILGLNDDFSRAHQDKKSNQPKPAMPKPTFWLKLKLTEMLVELESRVDRHYSGYWIVNDEALQEYKNGVIYLKQLLSA